MRTRHAALTLLVAVCIPGAGLAQVDTLSMESRRAQVDGVDSCYSHAITYTGNAFGLVSLTTPPGNFFSPVLFDFESSCFASLAALEAVFPRDQVGTYDFVFSGQSDSDSISYSTVAFPACLPAITAPAHNSATDDTPTIEWSVGCALPSGSCHYAIERVDTNEAVFEVFDTDCPGSNSLSVAPGLLKFGKTYRFWVELTAGDGGTPAETNNLDPYTYFQSTQNSNEILFSPQVPVPTLSLRGLVAFGIALLAAMSVVVFRRLEGSSAATRATRPIAHARPRQD